MRYLMVAFALLAFSGSALAEPACGLPAAQSPDTVVGTAGGNSTTLGALDKTLGDELCTLKREYAVKVHGLRLKTLRRQIDLGLLEAHAQKLGTDSVDGLLKRLVEEATPAPSDADVRAFYMGNKGQMDGASLEDTKEAISGHLLQQAQGQAFQALMSTLRTAAKVKINLPVPRQSVPEGIFSKGPVDAPITIVEFGDYECPYCARGQEALKAVAKKYGKKVRFMFFDFPLDFHKRAVPAAIMARCAGAQGKYWEMHDLLFDNHADLSDAMLDSLGKGLKLDQKKLTACRADRHHLAAIAADQAAGAKIGVEGTPAFFVNGVGLSGAQPAEAFFEIIDAELAR